MKKYKVLIVGAGNIGALLDDPQREEVLTHAHACNLIPAFNDFAFTDVSQSNLNRAAELWKKKTYLSFEEALVDFGPDIISFCTPPMFRLPLIEKISENLKYVFLEKPLATNISEVERIVSHIKQKGIPSSVNYSRLFSNDINMLGKAITEKKYGRLIKGVFTYSKGLRNNGSHVLSLLQFLFGEIAKWKILGTSFDYSAADPNCDLELEFSNHGKVYMLALDENKFSNIECHLFFEKARITLKQFGHQIQISPTRSDPIYQNYVDFDETASFYKTDLDRTMLLAYKNIFQFLTEKGELTSSLENAVSVEKLLNDISQGI